MEDQVIHGLSHQTINEFIRLTAYKFHRGMPQHAILELDDLISYGYIGLLKAQKSYNPNAGASFKTYAYQNIHWAIQEGIREMFEGPRKKSPHAQKFEHVSLEYVIIYRESGQTQLVLIRELRDELRRLAPHFSITEWLVLQMHYWQGMTFVEIAKALNRTIGLVSMTHHSLIKKIRRKSRLCR